MQRVAERLALMILVCLDCLFDVVPLLLLNVFCFVFQIHGYESRGIRVLTRESPKSVQIKGSWMDAVSINS